jgi:hypothetical protein
MHLYLNYNHYVVELLNPTLESLRIITDQLECLKSKYRDFSEIQIAYTDLEADDVDYQTLLIDEVISHLRAIAEEKKVEIDKSINEIENVLRDTLDLESVLILNGYRSLKVSMKIAGRRNEFTIKPISDGRVSVDHDTMSLTTSDSHEFDSAKELAEKLHDLQILEKKAKDLFFSGTVFTSAYDS